MAALTTQVLPNVTFTTVAPTAGGDTAETGASSGGWSSSPCYFWAVIGTTATTITINGVANGPFTSQTVMLPITPGASAGARVNVTYSQVTGVTGVAVIRMGPALSGVTFGT